jgi:hypothetical protein
VPFLRHTSLTRSAMVAESLHEILGHFEILDG